MPSKNQVELLLAAVAGVIFETINAAGYLDVIKIVLKMWVIMLIMCGKIIFRNPITSLLVHRPYQSCSILFGESN
jgi:hypothetical protein